MTQEGQGLPQTSPTPPESPLETPTAHPTQPHTETNQEGRGVEVEVDEVEETEGEKVDTEMAVGEEGGEGEVME